MQKHAAAVFHLKLYRACGNQGTLIHQPALPLHCLHPIQGYGSYDRSAAVAPEGVYRFDPKMEEVTRFIREHLAEELTIERLAGTFFLSRFYLMHRFKDVYGCTVHQYIRQKRLQQAAEQIRQGVPVLKAAEEAGFGDYSVFLRAFRGAYGRSPREWK